MCRTWADTMLLSGIPDVLRHLCILLYTVLEVRGESAGNLMHRWHMLIIITFEISTMKKKMLADIADTRGISFTMDTHNRDRHRGGG